MSGASCPKCKLELFATWDYPETDEPNQVPAFRPFACPKCRAVIVHRDPADRWAMRVTGTLWLGAAIALCVRAGWWGLWIAVCLVVPLFFVQKLLSYLFWRVVPDRIETYSVEKIVSSASSSAIAEEWRGNLVEVAELLDEFASIENIPPERRKQLRKLLSKMPNVDILKRGAYSSERLASELARKSPGNYEVEALGRELREVASVLRLLTAGSDTGTPPQT